jgi:hypothetical protein
MISQGNPDDINGGFLVHECHSKGPDVRRAW